MNKDLKQTILVFGSLIGAISGIIAGLIGDGVLTGLITGAITGGVVGLFYPERRFDGGPRANVAALPPAGLVAGAIASLFTDAGFIGAFLSCGIGYTLGLALPAIIAAFITKLER